MPPSVRIIRVFVSSPGDVQAERGVLAEAVASINRTEGEAHGVQLQLLKWEDDVTPQIGPLPQQVIDAQLPPYEIYLGIMSTRFGSGGTEQEFRDALQKWQAVGQPWITFYFDDAPRSPASPTTSCSTRKPASSARDSKRRASSAATPASAAIPGQFFEQVSEHLRAFVHRLAPDGGGPRDPRPPADSTAYLRDLLAKSAWIDIRGLVVGKGQAHRFPIEELFISLTTTLAPTRRSAGASAADRKRPAAEEEPGGEARAVPLHAALQHDRLVVVGDPGAGKTTFLRRIVHALCQTQLGEQPTAAQDRLGLSDRTFPVCVRLSDLAQHLQRHDGRATAPGDPDAPAWLPHYLAALSQDNEWGLDADFFRQQLEGGQCTVLLDGLDEAPDRVVRQRLTRVIQNAAGQVPRLPLGGDQPAGGVHGRGGPARVRACPDRPAVGAGGGDVPGSLVPGVIRRRCRARRRNITASCRRPCRPARTSAAWPATR